MKDSDAPREGDGGGHAEDACKEEDVASEVEKSEAGRDEAMAEGEVADEEACKVAHPLAVR